MSGFGAFDSASTGMEDALRFAGGFGLYATWIRGTGPSFAKASSDNAIGASALGAFGGGGLKIFLPPLVDSTPSPNRSRAGQ